MNRVTVRGITIGEGKPKVCVPVMGENDEAVLFQAGAAAAVGADLIEWRADAYDGALEPERVSRMLKKLRELLSDIPLLFTFRTSEEGGARAIAPEDYLKLNETAAKSGLVDLIDVEIHRAPDAVSGIITCAHEAGIYVVGSYHDFHKTPEEGEMLSHLMAADAAGADIVKLAVMPQSMADVLRLLNVTLEAPKKGIKKPLITMSMGEMGSISRVCGEYFGSAVTFGQAQQGSAPGQFRAGALKTMLDILHEKAPSQENAGNVPGRPIFLIGFMGTGKSSVAAKLHELTGMEVVEMDAALQQREKRTISRIFEEDGEEYFRDMETAFIKELTSKEAAPVIVSCGGGAVLRPENRAMMKAAGTTILLTAAPETIYARVGGSKERPNLKNRKTVADIRALMEERREKYEAAAQIIIETDGKTLEDIGREILAHL